MGLCKIPYYHEILLWIWTSAQLHEVIQSIFRRTTTTDFIKSIFKVMVSIVISLRQYNTSVMLKAG